MSTTKFMIELSVQDSFLTPVTSISGAFAYATMSLDPHRTTVVREVAACEIGGVLALNMPATVNLSFTTRALAEVDLIARQGHEGAGASLFGPSCVPSPPFSWIKEIALHLNEAGFTAPAGVELSAQLVGAGGHVYFDQIS
jgi:hypothetical protein